MPAPPAEFLAIQVSRLNEALLVAYSGLPKMMRDKNSGDFSSVRRCSGVRPVAPEPPLAGIGELSTSHV